MASNSDNRVSDPPLLRYEDYCFGRRIVDEKNHFTRNFRGTKPPHDQWRPTTTTSAATSYYFRESLEPSRSSFNRRSTFGSPPPAHRSQRTASEGSRSQSHSAASPPRSLTGTVTEYTSTVPSFINPRGPAPNFGPKKAVRPVSSSSRHAFVENKLATATEYTAVVPSTLKVVPKRARPVTPPATSRRPTADGQSRRTTPAGGGEYSATLPSTLNLKYPRPVARRAVTPRTGRRTDEWQGRPKDPGPGPGQYFVP